MRRGAADVTDTELAILHVLWDRGEATRRQLADALYPGGADAQYATVQKLLERLEGKGYVRHRRDQGVLHFRPTVDRDTLIGRRLQDVADKLCDGAVTPLLMHLVRARRLAPRELDELQALLEELRRHGPKGKPR